MKLEEMINKVHKLNMFEKGWLSSAIDGEGTIGYDDKNHALRIGIYNTDKNFIDYAKKLMKGNVFTRPATSKRKLLYRVEVGDKKRIIYILKQILPFLIIKKEIAIKVLAMAQKRGIYGINTCCMCNEKHYSRGWCIKHWYENYGKAYHKKWRKSKI